MSSNRTAAASTYAAASTRWSYVVLLLASGIGAATQVGKVPASLRTLQNELHLTIWAAAWVISMFNVVGSFLGFLAGSVTDHIGARRAAVFGLTFMAIASLLGGSAANAAALLATRALEGLGFVLVVVAIPGLLFASSAAQDRRFVPALWGTYMPLGTAIALMLAPTVLQLWGWRVLWRASALLLAALAAALLIVPAPRLARGRQAVPTPALRRAALLHRGPLLLGLIFACYTVQYLSVLGFLPAILVQQGTAAQRAGNLTALAVIANALGNLAASALAARGVPARPVIACACAATALTCCGIYSPALEPSLRYVLVVVFSAFAGLVPASIFASVPHVTPERGSAAITMGFVVQASHLGQLLGPPTVAAVATVAGGWQLSALVLVPAALTAFVAALSLRGPH